MEEILNKYHNIQEIYTAVMLGLVETGKNKIASLKENYANSLSGEYEARKKLKQKIVAGEKVIKEWKERSGRKVDLSAIDERDVETINKFGIEFFIKLCEYKL